MTRPFQIHPRRQRDRGAALFIAIGLLAVFIILGFYYINYMALEWDETHYEIGRTRARLAAEAGIRLALADLQYAQRQNQTVQVLSRPLEYALPVYVKQQGAGELQFAESESYAARASVAVADENARVNINHAPASVLQRLLGIDGAMARAIVRSMPRTTESEEAAVEEASPEAKKAAETLEEAPREWFLSVDELVDRGFVTPEQYAELDTSLLTAYTVTDHEEPAGYLNINHAPAPVLAAALDLPLERAEELAATRPFKSLEGLAKAVGKAPETFNYRPSADGAGVMPAEFSLASKTFRLLSTGNYVKVSPAGAEEQVVSAQIEAVVQATGDGTWQTLHWALNPEKEVQ